jgi:hypothetical protein
MAATDKYLALNNKSCTRVPATKKQPAARRIPLALPVFTRPLAARVALKLDMSWHHPDQFFFLCLAGSLAAFLAPSIIDELTTTVDELFGRRRKPPVVLPLDGLQRDRPARPTKERASERPSDFSRLCESVTPLPPKEQASRVREHFGIVGGVCPPLNRLRNRFRRRFTPGEVHRVEQRSHTRL